MSYENKYRSICTFSKELDCSFVQNELKDFIRKHFSSYRDFISWLENYFSENIDCNLDLSNLSLFILEARERTVTIKDLRAIDLQNFKFLNREIGDEVIKYTVSNYNDKITELKEKQTDIQNKINNLYGKPSIDFELSLLKSELKKINDEIDFKTSSQYHNIHINQRIKWEIENPKYKCSKKVIEGLYLDKNIIIYPALWDGCYSVKCSISTDTVDRKLVLDECLFSVIPEKYEIIAFESDNEKSKNSIDYKTVENLQTDWNMYSNYLKQDFNLNYYHQLDVLEKVDDGIIIKGLDDNKNLIKYIAENFDNYYNYSFYKSYFDVVENEYITVTKEKLPVRRLYKNKIIIDKGHFGTYNLKNGWSGKLQLYRQYTDTNFRFNIENDNKFSVRLWLSNDEIRNKIAIGSHIYFENEFAKMYFKIISLKYIQIDDFQNSCLVELNLEDNGSLRFPDSRTGQNLLVELPEDLKYIFTNFENIGTKLYFQFDRIEVLVTDTKIRNNSDEVTLITSLGKQWDYIKKIKDNIDWFVDFNTDYGLVQINHNNIEITELDENRFKFTNIPNEILCKLTTDYKFLIADFDIINSNRQIHLDFDIDKNLDTNIIIDEKRLHSPYLNGFYIGGFENLKFTDILKIETKNKKIENIQVLGDDTNIKVKLIETLNELKLGIKFSFDEGTGLVLGIFESFYNNISDYIFKISEPLFVLDKCFPYIKNEKFEFSDYKNNSYLENGFIGNSFDIPKTNLYTSYQTDTFFIKKDTRVIFTITNKFKFLDTEFEWRLQKRDENDKLMVISNLNYLTWKFNERGTYTVILSDNKGNSISKTGWINVI